MRYLFNILVIFGIIMTFTSNAMEKEKTTSSIRSLFENDPHEDMYWDALVKVSHGKKQEALEILDSIKSRKRKHTSRIPEWKENRPKNIDDLFDKMFIKQVQNDPELLTHISLFESVGVNHHNAYFSEISLPLLEQNIEEAKDHLQLLRTYDPSELSEHQKISAKIFEWTLDHEVREKKFLLHEYIVHQLDGILFALNIIMTELHTLETEHDVQNYIERLNKIPQKLRQTIQFMNQQCENGIVPPRFTIEKVINSIRKMIPEQTTENIFYTHLSEKLKELALENSDTLLEQAHRAVISAVYPAYRELEQYFMKLLEHAQANNGVWALPHGDEYYTYVLRSEITTDMSADEIHELGLQEVAKIHEEMRTIFEAEQIDTRGKSTGDLLRELSKDPKFHYPNTDEGRQQCLADYHAILERSRKELAHLFNLKPRSGVVIKPVPEAEQEGSAGAYYLAPSADGSRPGTFFANLRNMSEVPKYGMETLAIHEAEPGHHFQLALQYEMTIPMLRKLGQCNAYVEGWALYAEKLAYEHGFYSSSFSRIGHLQDELLRAARLVIDTGIHHKRWTREQAITYMKEVTGYHDDNIVSEIERYFVMPGQACSYKIGQLTILRLRKEAQERLHEKFDIREFHDEILKVGNVPLAILEDVIHAYIERKLAQ